MASDHSVYGVAQRCVELVKREKSEHRSAARTLVAVHEDVALKRTHAHKRMCETNDHLRCVTFEVMHTPFLRLGQAGSTLKRGTHITTRLALALLATGLPFAGCGKKDAETGKTGAAGPGDSEAAGPGTRTAKSEFDAGVAEGDYCYSLVAAECDGNEDCPSGQICCGMFDGGALRYNSIRCQETCDGSAGGIELCHPGDVCPNAEDAGIPDGSAPVCHHSVLLPPYLAVCGTPIAGVPTDLIDRPAAAQEVNCGETLVCGAGMKCCVLGSWDAATQTTTTREGYCAAMDEDCTCTSAPDGG